MTLIRIEFCTLIFTFLVFCQWDDYMATLHPNDCREHLPLQTPVQWSPEEYIIRKRVLANLNDSTTYFTKETSGIKPQLATLNFGGFGGTTIKFCLGKAGEEGASGDSFGGGSRWLIWLTGFVNGLYRWRNIDVGRHRIHVANWKGLIDVCVHLLSKGEEQEKM